MRKRISDRSLKERLRGYLEWLAGGEVVVEGFQGSEKADFFIRPRARWGIVPALTSLHRAERPIEQITHVGEDLNGLATAAFEGEKTIGSMVKSARGAIGDSGNSVAKEFAFVVHNGNIPHPK